MDICNKRWLVIFSSICLPVNFSQLHLLPQNHWANFSQTWHRASLSKGDWSFSNEGPHHFPREDDYKIAKYIDEIIKIFSRTIGSISTNLTQSMLWWWGKKVGAYDGDSAGMVAYKKDWKIIDFECKLFNSLLDNRKMGKIFTTCIFYFRIWFWNWQHAPIRTEIEKFNFVFFFLRFLISPGLLSMNFKCVMGGFFSIKNLLHHWFFWFIHKLKICQVQTYVTVL